MNLRQELDRYLTIRRRLGYDLSSTERVLRRFIAFAESQGAHHISTDLFVRWQAVFGHAQRRTWAARLGMVRLSGYPLTGAFESRAATVPEIIRETADSVFSERRGRV